MVTHQHAEAFKLLTFECDRCGFQENIWNSRDGLIQYTVDCPHCFGGWMRRAVGDEGLYLPSYEPNPGERMFTDLSMEKAINVALEKLSDAYENKEPGVPKNTDDLIRRILLCSCVIYDSSQGQPDLITVEG